MLYTYQGYVFKSNALRIGSVYSSYIEMNAIYMLRKCYNWFHSFAWINPVTFIPKMGCYDSSEQVKSSHAKVFLKFSLALLCLSPAATPRCLFHSRVASNLLYFPLWRHAGKVLLQQQDLPKDFPLGRKAKGKDCLFTWNGRTPPSKHPTAKSQHRKPMKHE